MAIIADGDGKFNSFLSGGKIRPGDFQQGRGLVLFDQFRDTCRWIKIETGGKRYFIYWELEISNGKTLLWKHSWLLCDIAKMNHAKRVK